MKKRKILLTTILAFIALSTMSTLSNAALQSNSKTTRKTNTATNWVINVRNMEAKNGGMGLSEVIDNTTGLATTASNGIDVHLQKNTEYGAAILLGASDYGKQGLVGGTGSNRYMNNGDNSITGITIKRSTTGNVTGIYDTATATIHEWTAGGGTDFLSNIAPRYRDIYETATIKPGDAVLYWHGTKNNAFATGGVGFVRGDQSYSVFSFNAYSGTISSYSYGARACVVSAPGI